MNARQKGFTIVELLVVIIVIGILAGVTIIGYGAWRNDIVEKQLKSDLYGAASAIESDRNFNQNDSDDLPAGFQESDGIEVIVKSGGGTYCIQATSEDYPDKVFNLKNRKQPAPGPCDAYYTSSVTVGNYTSCGIEYGKAYCWGESGSGSIGSRLGNGQVTNASSPVPVDTSLMTGKVTAIASTNSTVCAIADGKVYCWGNGTGGLLGNGSTTASTVPVAVDTSAMNGVVTHIEIGGTNACAIAGGQVYCWGVGTSGQLGNGTTPNWSAIPVAVNRSNMVGEVTSIVVGNAHICAIANSKLYCWGAGANGRIGIGSTANVLIPTPVNTSIMSGNVTKITTSNSHTCAIASEKAYCWGGGGYSPTANGHLGTGSTSDTSIPTAVISTVMSGAVTDIETRNTTTCAIADQKAYCWGDGGNRMGNGSSSGSTVPVAVSTSLMSGSVSSIHVHYTVCAVSEGKVYCWGTGTSGQLGNGASVSSNTPVAVNTSAMTGAATKVAHGFTHACAIADDRMYCWGGNSYGQLGIGNTTVSNVPGMVVPNP